jgi:hypothetical protein
MWPVNKKNPVIWEEQVNLVGFNYLLMLIIFKPARAASLVCLSSNVRNRSAFIDKAEATWKRSKDLEPVSAECFFDKSMA